MKLLRIILCAAVILSAEPALATSTPYSETLRINANGATLPTGKNGEDNKAISFTNGVTVNKANLGLTKEIYVSIRTDEPPCGSGATADICGNGTKLDPYNAGGITNAIKANRLTAILTTFQPDYIIHYASGTYYTYGWMYQTRKTAGTGCKHFGEGQGKTIIKLYGVTGDNSQTGYIFGCDSSTARSDGFELHHMTLDADAVHQSSWPGGAHPNFTTMRVRGSNMWFEDIEVIGCGTKSGECFMFMLRNFGGTGAFDNNLVEKVYVHAPAAGNTDNLACIGMGTGYAGSTAQNNVVRDCVIDMTGADAPSTTGTHADVVERCKFYGLVRGTYVEPQPGTSGEPMVEVRNCEYRSCVAGINFVMPNGAPYSKGARIHDNLAVDCGAFVDVWSLYGYPNGSTIFVDEVSVSRNTCVKSDGTVSTDSAIRIHTTKNVLVEDNHINSSNAQAIYIWSTNPPVVRSNRKLDGTLVPYQFLNSATKQTDSVPMDGSGNVTLVGDAMLYGNLEVGRSIRGSGSEIMGVHVNAGDVMTTRRPINDANYQILTGNADYVVAAVKITAPHTWTLPNANLCDGCVRILKDESGDVDATNKITIVPNIETHTLEIDTPFKSFKLYSNGNDWFTLP